MADTPDPTWNENISSEICDEIAAERFGQVEREGYTLAHDDAYTEGDLVKAAAAYALFTVSPNRGVACHPICWPWSPHVFKPTTPRADLIKAGALIVAEIERIDRRAARAEA